MIDIARNIRKRGTCVASLDDKHSIWQCDSDLYLLTEVTHLIDGVAYITGWAVDELRPSRCYTPNVIDTGEKQQ